MSTADASPYTPFTVSVVPDRDEVAVVLAGELDLASVDELERAVAELKVAGFQSIVIDLHEVDFIDSTGLRMLIALRNDAKRNGHALKLVSPGPTTSRIFGITGTRGPFGASAFPARTPRGPIAAPGDRSGQTAVDNHRIRRPTLLPV